MVSGEVPFALTTTPDGKYVLVNGASDSGVAVFSRDPANGALTFVDALISPSQLFSAETWHHVVTGAAPTRYAALLYFGFLALQLLLQRFHVAQRCRARRLVRHGRRHQLEQRVERRRHDQPRRSRRATSVQLAMCAGAPGGASGRLMSRYFR